MTRLLGDDEGRRGDEDDPGHGPVGGSEIDGGIQLDGTVRGLLVPHQPSVLGRARPIVQQEDAAGRQVGGPLAG